MRSAPPRRHPPRLLSGISGTSASVAMRRTRVVGRPRRRNPPRRRGRARSLSPWPIVARAFSSTSRLTAATRSSSTRSFSQFTIAASLRAAPEKRMIAVGSASKRPAAIQYAPRAWHLPRREALRRIELATHHSGARQPTRRSGHGEQVRSVSVGTTGHMPRCATRCSRPGFLGLSNSCRGVDRRESLDSILFSKRLSGA